MGSNGPVRNESMIVTKKYCVTSIWNIHEYANFVSSFLDYLISAVSL